MLFKEPLKLAEASDILNTPADTLRQQCFRKQIAGVKVRDGKKMVWAIPPAEMERLLSNRSNINEYDKFHAEWVFNMERGLGYRCHLSAKGKAANIYGMEKFWLFLEHPPKVIKSGRKKGEPPLIPYRTPNIADITLENLQISMANIPIEKDNCHFSMRDQMFKGFKSFFKLLIRKGLRTRLEFLDLEEAKPARKVPEKRPVYTEGQLNNLIATNDVLISGRHKSKVDYYRHLSKVVLLLGGLAGLRRQEIIDLPLDGIRLQKGELHFIGKGGIVRTVGISPEVYQVTHDWMTVYRPKSKYPNLLLQPDGTPLTGDMVYKRVRRLGKRIGIQANVHALRRTCATIAIDQGVDLQYVSKNLGHTRTSTTEKCYVSVNERKATSAFKKIRLRKTAPLESIEEAAAQPDLNAEKAAKLLELLQQVDLL